MVRLELTAEEAAALREVLQSYLSDLRMEIADTERLEFRRDLKKTEVLLDQLIARLS
jgi:hypothetical protein